MVARARWNEPSIKSKEERFYTRGRSRIAVVADALGGVTQPWSENLTPCAAASMYVFRIWSVFRTLARVPAARARFLDHYAQARVQGARMGVRSKIALAQELTPQALVPTLRRRRSTRR
eukprot:856250-Pleurochrysis_carterae.AAC.2